MKEARRSGSLSIRALAMGATAIGAIATGAVAIGVPAVGRLAIGRVVVTNSKLKSIEVGESIVTRPRVAEVWVSDKLWLGAEKQKS